jgi:hypothetical protein
MSSIGCKVCGKPAVVHLTDVAWLSGRKPESHYCRDHVPVEIRSRMPAPADEGRIVEQLIAQLDARNMDPAEKAKAREELRQLAADTAAGRRRLGESA